MALAALEGLAVAMVIELVVLGLAVATVIELVVLGLAVAMVIELVVLGLAVVMVVLELVTMEFWSVMMLVALEE